MQWYDTGWFSLVFVIVLSGFILLNIRRAKGPKDLYLRRIPGLNAIDEAIGRATEMGKPVLMVPGIGDVATIGVQAQALTIFGYIARTIARFASPMRLCVANPATFTLAQEVIRDSYQQEGALDRFNPDSVQFLTDQQFPFAAGVAGIIHRDKTAACFFMGPFYAESLIFAESANQEGAIQIAGSTQSTQTPFFIAACDYVLIGEEFYAASAYLGRDPIHVGSLVGQDWCKMLIAFTMAAGVLITTVQMQMRTNLERKPDGRMVAIKDLKEPRVRSFEETYMGALLTPALPIKGEAANKNYADLLTYMAERSQELGATAEASVGAAENIEDQDGKWYKWELEADGAKYSVEDFLVVTPTGVTMIRTYRSRPQAPEEPSAAPAGGAE